MSASVRLAHHLPVKPTNLVLSQPESWTFMNNVKRFASSFHIYVTWCGRFGVKKTHEVSWIWKNTTLRTGSDPTYVASVTSLSCDRGNFTPTTYACNSVASIPQYVTYSDGMGGWVFLSKNLNNGSNIIKPWALAHGFMILEPLFKQNIKVAGFFFSSLYHNCTKDTLIPKSTLNSRPASHEMWIRSWWPGLLAIHLIETWCFKGTAWGPTVLEVRKFGGTNLSSHNSPTSWIYRFIWFIDLNWLFFRLGPGCQAIGWRSICAQKYLWVKAPLCSSASAVQKVLVGHLGFHFHVFLVPWLPHRLHYSFVPMLAYLPFQHFV